MFLGNFADSEVISSLYWSVKIITVSMAGVLSVVCRPPKPRPAVGPTHSHCTAVPTKNIIHVTNIDILHITFELI